jgi:hypothetical protein
LLITLHKIKPNKPEVKKITVKWHKYNKLCHPIC